MYKYHDVSPPMESQGTGRTGSRNYDGVRNDGSYRRYHAVR